LDEGQLPPRRRLREPRDERGEATERDLDPGPEEGGLPLLVRREHQEKGGLQGGVDRSVHTNTALRMPVAVRPRRSHARAPSRLDGRGFRGEKAVDGGSWGSGGAGIRTQETLARPTV